MQNDLQVVDISAMISLWWTPKQVVEKLIEIDYTTIENLKEEDEGDSSQWTPIAEKYPTLWKILVTKSRDIVWALHYAPISDDILKEILDGTLCESSLTFDKIPVFIPGKTYTIYLIAITLLPEYQKTHASTLLERALINDLLELEKRTVHIGSLYTNAYTQKWENHVKKYDFQYVRDHLDHGKIYMTTLPRFVARFNELHPQLHVLNLS